MSVKNKLSLLGGTLGWLGCLLIVGLLLVVGHTLTLVAITKLLPWVSVLTVSTLVVASIAMLAALLKGHWGLLLELVLLTITPFGVRAVAMHFSESRED